MNKFKAFTGIDISKKLLMQHFISLKNAWFIIVFQPNNGWIYVLCKMASITPGNYEGYIDLHGAYRPLHEWYYRIPGRLCAMSALRWDKEIKAYYERKVMEGKNKMSVINAIRNKLLLRIFAVLRD